MHDDQNAPWLALQSHGQSPKGIAAVEQSQSTTGPSKKTPHSQPSEVSRLVLVSVARVQFACRSTQLPLHPFPSRLRNGQLPTFCASARLPSRGRHPLSQHCFQECIRTLILALGSRWSILSESVDSCANTQFSIKFAGAISYTYQISESEIYHRFSTW
jgi:hypothetical protein